MTTDMDQPDTTPLDSTTGAAPPVAKPALRRPNRLLWHMYVSYFWLRIGMGALAFVLPIVVLGSYAVAHRTSTPLGSLSEYYQYGFAGHYFTGTLFAVGMGLLMYKGFTPAEDRALSAAGIGGLLVALVPHDTLKSVHLVA